MSRYEVYAADSAGSVVTKCQTDEPHLALDVLRYLRINAPHLAYGVWDSEAPEAGNCEARLEELVEEGP